MSKYAQNGVIFDRRGIKWLAILILTVNHPAPSNPKCRNGATDCLVGSGLEIEVMSLRPIGNWDDFLGSQFGDTTIESLN